MPQFEYIATNKEGKEFSGVSEGHSPQEIAARLKQQGLEATSISLLPKKPFSPFRITKKISLDDLTLFNSQLASMLETELPLVPSLKQIAKDIRRGKFKTIIEDIARSVESGNSLYESLSKHPEVFSEFYLKVIDAGEKTGNLSAVLHELTTYSLRILSFRGRVRDALIYPLLLVAVGLAVIVFFLTVIAPTFMAMFKDFTGGHSHCHLPVPTALFVRASYILTNYHFQIVGTVIGLAVFIWLASLSLSRSPRGRVILGRIKMRVPLAGSIIRHISLIHFSRTLGTLLSGGVPLVEALELAGRSSPNRAIEDAVRQVIRSVEQGESLSESLQKTGFFPHSMVWMLSIGEKRGKVDRYLLHNAEVYQERLEGSFRRIEILVAPIAILVMGIFIFFGVISMFLPLVQMAMTVM